MKKYFFSILMACGLAQATSLTDAIIESDVKKVQECIQNGGKVETINLEIAQHIMEMRAQQRTHNSPLDWSVPGTAWNKVGMALIGMELLAGIHNIRSNLYLEAVIRSDYYRKSNLYNYFRCYLTFLGCGIIFAHNVVAWQYKKIKFLDQKHKDAITIYQLIRNATHKS